MASSRNGQRGGREARDRLRLYQARQSVHAHRAKRRMLDNIFSLAGVLIVVTLATITQVVYFSAGPGRPAATASPSPSASASAPATVTGQNQGPVPPKTLAAGRSWTGTLTLNTVSLGITLDGAAAPQATSAFIFLAQSGFYTGKTCHRLVNSGAYLIQCGSPTGNGTGNAGFSFGPIENAPANGIYPAGTIAMARLADPYSQGSQFFITYQDTKLDTSTGGYTVFGRVTAGLPALISAIVSHGVAAGGSSANDGPPAVPTTITGLTVK
ncbi:MAG: peptidylprolyl isomerase [Microbacteriaceae bacterium]